MKKASVKYVLFVVLLVVIGLFLLNPSSESNSITSAVAANPSDGRADWSGGVGPPPDGTPVDTFANLRNQVLSREGHVAPSSSQASTSNAPAVTGMGSLFSLAFNKITGGDITGIDPNPLPKPGAKPPADQPSACKAEEKGKCISCPPPCPMPAIPKIDQPGDGGGGGGGGAGGGGGGGGSGGGTPEEPQQCGPGSESLDESAMLSDDAVERYDAMGAQFDAPTETIRPSAPAASTFETQQYDRAMSMRTAKNPLQNPVIQSGMQRGMGEIKSLISGGQVVDIPSQESLSFTPIETDGYIELYNPLQKTIKLGGYELRDYTGNVVLSLPDGAEIGPEEYKVISFSPLFEQNFGTPSDYQFEGFSVGKFKGTIVLAYNGPEGFKYVDYVRYGEKSKPMYLSGDTPPAKQRFLPVDLEIPNRVIISEFTIDYSSKLAYVELFNVGQTDYDLNGHTIFVYAGEDYYEGGLNQVLPPGQPLVLTFSSAGSVELSKTKDWLCPSGYDPNTEICLSAPISADAEVSDFSAMKDAVRINHAGLIPRAEVALVKTSCNDGNCKPEIVDDFSKELESIPYEGVVSYKVAEQKILVGSATDRSGDFVEDTSPSLGVVEAMQNNVVYDIVSPGKKHSNVIEFDEQKAMGPGAPPAGYPASDSDVVLGGSAQASEGLRIITAGTISNALQGEVWSAVYQRASAAQPAIASPQPVAPLPSAAAQTVSMALSSVSELSPAELDEQKQEYFETPCETAVRLSTICKGGKNITTPKGKTLREKIAEFDVDAELETVLDALRQMDVDVDNPDVYKEQLGNIHSRLVERLFEFVWNDNHLLTNYKSDYRRLISSSFSYSVKHTLNDPEPIVSFEHSFDWKEKLITMNDFQLSKDYLGLNLEEKLFDINRAVYYKLGYDYTTYSSVNDPLAAHWNVLKFGAVPTEEYSHIRQRIDSNNLNIIFSGLGDDFGLLKHMNGFVRPRNNLDAINRGMKEVGYTKDEISQLASLIQKYPAGKASSGIPGLGIPPQETTCDDRELQDLADACVNTGGALSDISKSGFGDPIVSYQRIDMNEGDEYKKPFGSTSGMPTLRAGLSEASVGLPMLTAGSIFSPTGAAVSSNLRTAFTDQVKQNKVSKLESEKPQLYENMRKGISVAESRNALSKVNRELSALQPGYTDSMNTLADRMPGSADTLAMRAPLAARSDTESLTDIVAESTQDDSCSSGKKLSPCSRDLHILITEVFPGTVSFGAEAMNTETAETPAAYNSGYVASSVEQHLSVKKCPSCPAGQKADPVTCKCSVPASAVREPLFSCKTILNCQNGLVMDIHECGCVTPAERKKQMDDYYGTSVMAGAVITGGFSMITGMPVADASEALLTPEAFAMSQQPSTLEHGTGENGLVEHDETSENVDDTWEMLLACPGKGPGGCNDEPPIYPEPMPEPEPYPVDEPYGEYPEEDPISCGYVSNQVSTDRLNPTYTEGDFRIPFGYEIIKGPFSMECNGDSFDFSFTVPDQYDNVKVLRCDGQTCMETVLSETPVDELYCDGGPMSQSVEEAMTARQPPLDPLMLDVMFDVTKTLDQSNRAEEKGYSVQFDSGGFDVQLSTPDNYVYPAENPNYYIMGTPFVVSANVSGSVGASIAMPLSPKENYDGFGIFALVNGAWHYLKSNVDANTGKVIAHIDDINALMSEGKVMFAVMGMYCHNCQSTELNKVYDGGSKEAVVLVHGLTSTPSTWQFMVNDFSLTKQPYQVWVFGYPSSIGLDDAAIALANQLENISSGIDRIHLVGHSLGGMIIQQAVNFGDWNKMSFVKKVKKVIAVGTPNKGSPPAELYDKLRDVLVNSKKIVGAYFINPLVVNDVLNGRDIARVNGIDYYVVAGTKPYTFTSDYFASVNDGIVSVDSARFVGGKECGDMCGNYFEINLSHTDLISHPAARKVIEYIISMEQAQEDPVAPLVGRNQYGHTWIEGCSPSDRFVIVGNQIPERETPGILDCKCGNGQCDSGETLPSCPKDCAGNFGAWLCPWLPVAIPLILLIAGVLSAVYLITKRIQKKDISDVWRIADYILVAIGVILLILGLVICKYLSLLAILVVLVILILLLLDFFVPEKKEERRLKEIKKGVKKK